MESEHWILRVSSCVSEDKLASMVAQMVRNLPTMWETRVRSLGWEDPLEKGVATCSSILAWRISWTGSLVGCSPWACKELDLTEQPPHMVFNELSWGLNEVMSMWLPSRCVAQRTPSRRVSVGSPVHFLFLSHRKTTFPSLPCSRQSHGRLWLTNCVQKCHLPVLTTDPAAPSSCFISPGEC